MFLSISLVFVAISSIVLGQQTWSDPFYLQFDNQTVANVQQLLSNCSNHTLSYSAYEPLCGASVSPDGVIIVDPGKEISNATVFRITSSGELVTNNNDQINHSSFRKRAINDTLNEFSISNQGLLIYAGLSNWTIEWNGVTLNINSPGSNPGSFPATLNIVKVEESSAFNNSTISLGKRENKLEEDIKSKISKWDDDLHTAAEKVVSQIPDGQIQQGNNTSANTTSTAPSIITSQAGATTLVVSYGVLVQLLSMILL